jgi:Putative restriction endonuclease
MANLEVTSVKILHHAGTNPQVLQTYRENGHIVDEPRSEDGKQVSEERYWAEYYSHPHFSYEWNHGILEERPMPNYPEWSMYQWVLLLLNEYLRNEPIALTMALETAFRMALPHKTAIRKPDLGVILHTNQIPLDMADRSYHGIFDLCIESLSDGSDKDVDRDIVVKKAEYEIAGVREYFILDDGGLYMAFYRRTAAGVFAPIPLLPGGVIQSAVLSGFQFRIEDLHRQPPLIALIDDPIYQPFVLPEYQAERQRAELAEAALRAEQKRTVSMAARLKELGITLDE